jgi:hypothetical protein
MKKTIATLALIFALQGVYAQNINDMFNRYKEKEGAESVSIPSFLIKLGHLFMDKDDKDYLLIKGVNSVKTLDMEDCSSEVKESFLKDANKLNLSGYETLVQTKEKGETVKLIAKMDEEAIRELIILITGNEECGLTLLEGKLMKEDINMIMTEDKIMIDGRE